ncbi:MAG: 4Fe-4S cluster-binding domain-containing protein [Deltaproteobacteria bacterium]|nr:4Fe-4S cluster-binding domain-containing protein [Deltaproteobacteria bacterium]
MSLNIHAVLPRSRVNGPGTRLVIFFQGCASHCEGCFNLDTHSFEERELVTPEALLGKHLSTGIEGITVSGGEPFLQPAGLLRLLELAAASRLSTLVYTGYTIDEVLDDQEKARCLEYIDVLVDGPFDMKKLEPTLLARGSSNQKIHFLTSRYSLEDLYMPGKVEVIIGPDGDIRKTGFSSLGA